MQVSCLRRNDGVESCFHVSLSNISEIVEFRLWPEAPKNSPPKLRGQCVAYVYYHQNEYTYTVFIVVRLAFNRSGG
jgi:hypothetical protein